MRGVVYVAYGENARRECGYSVESLRRTGNKYDVSAICDKPIAGVGHVHMAERDVGGRWAKLNLDLLSPYNETLYLDADTRILGRLDAGFEILADGWELVIAPSFLQGDEKLWHIGKDERLDTFTTWGTSDILQLQGGVFWFRKCETITRFFGAWRQEWERFGVNDQAALLRALWRVPVKVWLMGRDWNGGDIVAHYYGRARR